MDRTEQLADLGEVFASESARLWRAVFAFTQDRALTDDAVAEAFAQCLRRGDAVADPRAWVWTAAFRIAAGELRDRRRTGPLPDLPVHDAVDEEPGRVIRALASLSANQRAAVLLRGYAGYPTAEVAEILGVGRATVRVHLARGRARLRELLRDEESQR